MGEWPLLSLHEAGVRVIDCEHKTPSAVEAGYPYVTIPEMQGGRINTSKARRISREDFIAWTRRAMPKDHDVVLSRRTNPGETATAEPGLQFALGQNLVLMRADGSRVYPPFLRWLVRGPAWWEQIGRFLNVGAVFDSLKVADIPNFVLPIPSIGEQRRAATILGALDDKIECDRRLTETQSSIARAFFESWLGDEARGDSSEGRIGDIADLNPESWSPNQRPEVVRYVDLGGIKSGRIEEVAELPGASAPSRAQRVLRRGDTIVGTVRPGNRSFALISVDGLTGSTGFAQLRPKNRRDAAFVYLAVTADASIARLARLADGGAYPAIRPAVVAETEVRIPAEGVLERFSRVAQPLLDRAAVAEAEGRTLALSREALLPRLLSSDFTIGA